MTALKLLVVEDDPPSLELITEVFRALEADVRPVGESQKAARLVNQERFDGIFLDLEMPGLHGFDLAQIVRSSTWNKSTPIVIVTGREQRDTMHHSFSVGATFFLQKPVDRQKLSNLLRTVRGPIFENRRRYARVPLNAEIKCRVGSRTLNGKTWNLSQGGMQVEVLGLAAGDPITLAFRMPHTGGMIDVSGSVVWSKDDRQGIYFTEISVENQQRLRDFISDVELSPR